MHYNVLELKWENNLDIQIKVHINCFEYNLKFFAIKRG